MNTLKSKSPLALPTSACASESAPDAGGNLSPGLPCVRSDDLIGKAREIMIEHAGAYYRLRITRANKLILTK